MNMPEINVVGDVGATFEVDGTFNVADVGHLADFTKMMLTQESFEWVISGSNLTGAFSSSFGFEHGWLTRCASSVGDWYRGVGHLARREEGDVEGYEQP